MSDTIDKQVRQVASDVFNIPMDRVTTETSPQTVEKWDSVEHLNFVLALEQAMNITLEPEDIERIRSVGLAIEVVRERGGR